MTPSPPTTKWWNRSLRLPSLGSQITWLSAERVFLRQETVCRNRCTMGWPWDGRYHIISSAPIRDEMVPTWAQLVACKRSSAMRNPPVPPPPDIWWSKVTLHPVWQHNVVRSTELHQWALQAPATVIKPLPLNIYGLVVCPTERKRGHCKVTSLILLLEAAFLFHLCLILLYFQTLLINK